MAVVFTLDKVALIVGVTIIIIILAYVFRFGRFSRRKKPAGASPGDGQQGSPVAS